MDIAKQLDVKDMEINATNIIRNQPNYRMDGAVRLPNQIVLDLLSGLRLERGATSYTGGLASGGAHSTSATLLGNLTLNNYGIGGVITSIYDQVYKHAESFFRQNNSAISLHYATPFPIYELYSSALREQLNTWLKANISLIEAVEKREDSGSAKKIFNEQIGSESINITENFATYASETSAIPLPQAPDSNQLSSLAQQRPHVPYSQGQNSKSRQSERHNGSSTEQSQEYDDMDRGSKKKQEDRHNRTLLDKALDIIVRILRA